MKVRSILERKGTRVVTVRVGETVAAAVRLLRRDDIGALVVKDVVRTEGNTVVGILSERDIVRALDERGPATLGMTVGDLMTGRVVHCTEDDDLERVIDLMREHRIRHVPVLEEGRMLGIVTANDVIGIYLPSQQGGAPARPAAGEAGAAPAAG